MQPPARNPPHASRLLQECRRVLGRVQAKARRVGGRKFLARVAGVILQARLLPIIGPCRIGIMGGGEMILRCLLLLPAHVRHGDQCHLRVPRDRARGMPLRLPRPPRGGLHRECVRNGPQGPALPRRGGEGTQTMLLLISLPHLVQLL